MSKKILIFDSPENCEDCKLIDYSHYGDKYPFCRITYDIIRDSYCIQDWCPLRELPEKEKELPTEKYQFGSLGKAFVSGWNACLDKILKEQDN